MSFALVCGYSQKQESVQEKKITELVNAIKSDQGNKALQAPGNIGSEKAVEPLVKLLKENDIQKRRAAAWALQKIPSQKR
jgi:HEAT repeat protein